MPTKTEHFLSLIEFMQVSSQGVSLKDIQNRFNISRRTAERLRNEIEYQFPFAFEEVETLERTKRWRLKFSSALPIPRINAKELAELQNAISLCKNENMHGTVENLSNLFHKIQSLISLEKRASIETDLDALLMAEGFAMRPGPKPKISNELICDIRTALLSNKEIEIRYTMRLKGGKETTQTIQPYALLYGMRHYLVAYSPAKNNQGFRLYSLSNIKQLKITDHFFERNPNFSIQKYAENSFGVFQEEPFDVIWHFKKEAANDAVEYEFHPTQKIEWQEDGSLIVRFRAGGRIEMEWELHRWGQDVTDLTEYPTTKYNSPLIDLGV
jgi:predicted DNA-binding transcriptional regulator YafY